MNWSRSTSNDKIEKFNIWYNLQRFKGEISGRFFSGRFWIRSFRIPLSSITAIKTRDLLGSEDGKLLLIEYNEWNKSRKIKIKFHDEDVSAHALVTRLTELTKANQSVEVKENEVSLNTLLKFFLIGIPLLAIPISSIISYPFFKKAFKAEIPERLNIAEVNNESPADDTLVSLNGKMMCEYAVKYLSVDGEEATVDLFCPIVGKEWNRGDKINLIALLKNADANEIQELSSSESLIGIVKRDEHEKVYFRSVRDFFKTEHGLMLSESPILLEVGADRSETLYIGIFILMSGIIGSVMMVTLVRVNLRRKWIRHV